MSKTKLIVDSRNDPKEVIIAIETDTCNAWIGLGPAEAIAFMQEIQRKIEMLASSESSIIMPPRLDG